MHLQKIKNQKYEALDKKVLNSNFFYKMEYIKNLAYFILPSFSILANNHIESFLNPTTVSYVAEQEESTAEPIEELIESALSEGKNEIKKNKIPYEQWLYEQYLTEYAHYYHLDNLKVIEFAKRTTNNFNNFYPILNCNDYCLDSIEAKCMLFVYLLNRNELALSLENLGVTKEDFVLEEEAEILNYDHISDLKLGNAYSYSEYVSKICDLFGVKDKSMVLAVSFSEMDVNDPQNASRTKNNFCGMRNRDFELMTFPTPEAGIISMCGNFKNRYNEYTIDNIEEFAGHYVKGDKTVSNEETEIWISNVEPFYNEITSNYTVYFPDEEDVQILALTK